MANEQLHAAKTAKNDEFYTQYNDIEAEMNAYIEYDKDVFRDKVILCPCDDPEWSNFTKYFATRFETFGLKKLICTSYAKSAGNRQISEYERNSPHFDEKKHFECGKIFILDRDLNGSGRIDKDDIQWQYLEGDGDFRSEEVTKLRDEADFIITNPPFSLFREFLAWIMEGEKRFIVVGNKNAITYKEIFPLIKDNKMWIGMRNINKDFWLYVPEGNPYEKLDEKGKPIKHIMACWFTNVDHGKRHEPIQLMSMEENLKYNQKLRKKLKKDYGKFEYPKYDNYDVIEVPLVSGKDCAIPSDYDGVMGVPITFLDRYCNSQFIIVGMAEDNGKGYSGSESKWDGKNPHCIVDGKKMFKRIFIRRKQDV